MGGSAIGGDLAAAALCDRLTKPLLTARGYELPSWAPPDSAVLCSSYSGNTEETLACYAAAEALGAQRIVATTGGELAELARARRRPGDRPAGRPPAAGRGRLHVLRRRRGRGAGLARARGSTPRSTPPPPTSASASRPAEDRAGELAAEIGDATPVIYGGDLTAPVAYRWKTQINENAKLPAFSAVLPEADHNELDGWSGRRAGGFAAIFLEDRDQHPRERQRFELTAKAIEPHAAAVDPDRDRGRDAAPSALLYAVMLGDLVSLELASARGVDPLPVEVIESFKRELGPPRPAGLRRISRWVDPIGGGVRSEPPDSEVVGWFPSEVGRHVLAAGGNQPNRRRLGLSIHASERSALATIARDPVSRRRFLTLSGAGSAGMLLAACGGGNGSDSSTGNAVLSTTAPDDAVAQFGEGDLGIVNYALTLE